MEAYAYVLSVMAIVTVILLLIVILQAKKLKELENKPAEMRIVERNPEIHVIERNPKELVVVQHTYKIDARTAMSFGLDGGRANPEAIAKYQEHMQRASMQELMKELSKCIVTQQYENWDKSIVVVNKITVLPPKELTTGERTHIC